VRSRIATEFEIGNLGVRELADAAGISTNTITRFERGEAFRAETLAAIRRAFEDAGVKFIETGKSGGPGVRLKG
jgi:transcriptional regulator with XRE-family HTH domain